jgi:polyhydroxyalkanoate synthase
VQHKHAPRPLPLFLELVRTVGETDPALAANALAGLSKYEIASRLSAYPERPVAHRQGPATLADCGGSGPPVVLVPSLINPPQILDLDEEVSLGRAIAAQGRRTFLLDWGPAPERSGLDLSGHVETLLLPLLAALREPPALIGYCLGGTMAIAAANMARVERVVTLASPWRFSNYPSESRAAVERLWENARPSAERLGLLPMEVLQGAFWSLDARQTVAKFAAFDDIDLSSDKARRFVTLEDWANEGEPLPFPAARELVEDLFGECLPDRGKWTACGRSLVDRLDCPLLNITAGHDRIAPAATVSTEGSAVEIPAGHVGMVVGSKRGLLHELLNDFLAGRAPRR